VVNTCPVNASVVTCHNLSLYGCKLKGQGEGLLSLARSGGWGGGKYVS